MPRTYWQSAWYNVLHVGARLTGLTLYGIRCVGREHVPRTGGAIILSNHQSHFDPVLIGLAADRKLDYLARRTLFQAGFFRWITWGLNPIPIDRDGMGLEGLKETLRRLKQDSAVLIFPEGTRTPDGEVAGFLPGFSALAKRAQVPLIPAAIDGAFQVWPRKQPLPRCQGLIRVHFGAPILPAELAQFEPRALAATLEQRVRALHAEARRLRERTLHPRTSQALPAEYPARDARSAADRGG